MKHSLEQLIEKRQSGKKIKFLFFWGHRPLKDGSIGASCFSQWWPCQFKVNDQLYYSAEHWMMHQKAELFGDTEIGNEILNSKSPAKAKQLGRKVKNFDVKLWDEKKYEIVKEGNRYKFSQNEELKTFLLNTKKRVLVEASPVDPIWGIGMANDHRDVEKPEKWRGQNLLGFALMEVRDKLEKK